MPGRDDGSVDLHGEGNDDGGHLASCGGGDYHGSLVDVLAASRTIVHSGIPARETLSDQRTSCC